MRIAKTVESIALGANPIANRILNRAVPLDEAFVQQVLSLTQFTWHGRRPKTATSLDILSLLVELKNRGARVSIDEYQNRTPWKVVAGQQHVGGTKRYGQIVGLISNRDHLSFSIRIRDESLHLADDQSDERRLRSYMIVDYDGSWNEQWNGFDWEKTDQEIAYLTRRKLLVDGEVSFKDYVHVNRRQSIFGAPYMLLKLLLLRIEDELEFRKAEKSHIEDMQSFEEVRGLPGVQCLATGPSSSISAPTFTVLLNGLACRGEYTPYAYDECVAMIKLLRSILRPQVQFVVRADEAAFYRHGLQRNFVANWIKDTAWVQQTEFSARIQIGDTLSLSYDLGEKEMRVAA